MSNTRYDAGTKTLWIHSEIGADALVDSAESSAWSRQLRSGATEDGRALERVAYVFADQGAAEYNRDALAFLQLGTFHGSLENPTPVGGQPPSFDTREDFGIS